MPTFDPLLTHSVTLLMLFSVAAPFVARLPLDPPGVPSALPVADPQSSPLPVVPPVVHSKPLALAPITKPIPEQIVGVGQSQLSASWPAAEGSIGKGAGSRRGAVLTSSSGGRQLAAPFHLTAQPLVHSHSLADLPLLTELAAPQRTITVPLGSPLGQLSEAAHSALIGCRRAAAERI